MAFYVVRYDLNSMAEDPERPGHAVGYTDPSVNAPEPLDPPYGDAGEARAKIEEMKSTGGGETIEITLANGKPYKGPRYMYCIAVG